MKRIATALMFLTLALVAATPALASGGEQVDTATKTFELTLYGEVPSDQLFAVGYATREQLVAGAFPDPVPYILVCGTLSEGDDAPAQVVTEGACVGDEGTTYRADVELHQRGLRGSPRRRGVVHGHVDSREHSAGQRHLGHHSGVGEHRVQIAERVTRDPGVGGRQEHRTILNATDAAGTVLGRCGM